MLATRNPQEADRLIHRELNRRAQTVSPASRGAAIQMLAQPVSWILPRLLRLIMEQHDKPVASLAPIIRQMLHDQAYANVGGDCIDCELIDGSLDETVALIVKVLGEMRDEQ